MQRLARVPSYQPNKPFIWIYAVQSGHTGTSGRSLSQHNAFPFHLSDYPPWTTDSKFRSESKECWRLLYWLCNKAWDSINQPGMVVSAKFRPLLFCPVLLHSVPFMYPAYSFTEDWDKTTLQSSAFHSSLAAAHSRSSHHAPHRVRLSLPDRDSRSATHDSTITCCSVI